MSLKGEATHAPNASSDGHLCFLYKTVNGPLDVIPCNVSQLVSMQFTPLHTKSHKFVFSLQKKIPSLIRGSYLIKKQPPF